jgi:predicted  nucleic acid-binding Zn-ribbon protein
VANEALGLEIATDRRTRTAHATEIKELREAHQQEIEGFEAELKRLQAQIQEPSKNNSQNRLKIPFDEPQKEEVNLKEQLVRVQSNICFRSFGIG